MSLIQGVLYYIIYFAYPHFTHKALRNILVAENCLEMYYSSQILQPSLVFTKFVKMKLTENIMVQSRLKVLNKNVLIMHILDRPTMAYLIYTAAYVAARGFC